jgi:hypothetical protein
MKKRNKKQKEKIRQLIINVLTEKPETRANNDLLAYHINIHFINTLNLQSARGMAMAFLKMDMPNQHIIAAMTSVIKRNHPELAPTPEQLENKLKVQEEFINDSRASQEQLILNNNREEKNRQRIKELLEERQVRQSNI